MAFKGVIDRNRKNFDQEHQRLALKITNAEAFWYWTQLSFDTVGSLDEFLEVWKPVPLSVGNALILN